MIARSLALVAAGVVLTAAACGSSNKKFPDVALTPFPTPATPIATTVLGTRGPNATPRVTPAGPCTATPSPSFPTAAMPTPPAGAAAVQTTADGLQIQDLVPGTGATAAAGQKVTVAYIGWLDNGTVFDRSAAHPPGTFSFNLGAGQVIKGWDEGVQGMKTGGTRRLVVPPSLGYGSQQAGQIPPNSRLTFDVQLLCVG